MTTRKLQGPLGGDYQTDGKGNAVLLNTYPLAQEDNVPLRLADHEARVTAAEGEIAAFPTFGDVTAALTSAVSAVPVSTGLPDVPDLHAHWDAGSLGLADGARVSSWLDEVASRDAAQATSGNQPLYVANAINGRPGLYFDASRVDRLSATIAPSNAEATVIVVAVPNTASVTRFALGSNTSTKNLYFEYSSGYCRWGMQAASNYLGTGLFAAPQIVAAVYNGASSVIRVDGVATTGDVGAHATKSTALTIGHRASLSGNAYDGIISEVLWYDRALATGEIEAIERYLGAKYGIGSGVQTVWYLDSTAGNDGNTGRTAGAPIKTMARLMQGLKASAPAATTLTALIAAPSEAPLRLNAAMILDMPGSHTVRLLPANPARPWYAYGSERITSGWTHTGNGVYSHALTRSSKSGLIAWVPDLLDADGLPARIHTNAATQTAPAEGEYGWASNIYYLHLPGDRNPNSYAIEIPLIGVVVTAAASGMVCVIEDAELAGSTDPVAHAQAGGKIIARRSTAKHGQTGWTTSGSTPGTFEGMDCLGTMCVNDGFNIHGTGGRSVLINCEGAYNDDEGASPHDSTYLVVVGGRYHHNGSGGITAANQCTLDLLPYQGVPVEADHNRRIYLPSVGNADRGGIVAMDTAVANVFALNSHDNPGPGISRQSTTTWNVLGTVTSGTAAGNGVADEVV